MARDRFRNFNITINPGADCFEDFQDSLLSLIGVDDFYAWICHDKDKCDNVHYHLVLSFKNPKDFTKIQKCFMGAHIAECYSLSASCRYLIHNDNDNKYQYSLDEVHSSNIDIYTQIANGLEYEKFIDDKLPYYMFIDGDNTYLKLCIRFGTKQCSPWLIQKVRALQFDFQSLCDDDRIAFKNQLLKLYGDLPF
jgi:hypothetical protein